MIPEKAVIRRTMEALENAERSMFSVISWKKFSDLMLNARKLGLIRALKRGVKLQFIIEKPEKVNQISKIVETLRKKYSFDIRYLPFAPLAHLAFIDNKEVFINTTTTGKLAETPILWSNSSCLVAVVHDYLETLWLTTFEEYNAAV